MMPTTSLPASSTSVSASLSPSIALPGASQCLTPWRGGKRAREG
jgi:hypothetical protein